MKKYYDEFQKLTVDKISQSIEDMTYTYEETRVPKAHYKKLLNKQLEEVIADNVELNLLAPYITTIKALLEQSPKSFIQALLCVQKKVNINNVKPAEYDALQIAYSTFLELSHNSNDFVKTEVSTAYDNVIRDSASSYVDRHTNNEGLN